MYFYSLNGKNVFRVNCTKVFSTKKNSDASGQLADFTAVPQTFPQQIHVKASPKNQHCFDAVPKMIISEGELFT